MSSGATRVAPARGPERDAQRPGSMVRAPTIEQAHSLLVLQRTAGNRAVARLLAAAARVQRQAWDEDDPDAFTSQVDPGPLALRSADTGAPADTMTWSELQRAIDEHEGFIAEQTATTPEVLKREKRLAALRAAQEKLGKQAATARAPKAGRGG